MKDHSQNGEQQVILDYFADKTGTFLSIGENDGVTLSNVRALALLGWKGVCVEPADEPFEKLQNLYDGTGVECWKIAIGNKDGIEDFWDMGSHLGSDDTSLLATTKESELLRWKGTVDFRKTQCLVWTFASLLENSSYKKFDFVSIDAEGLDYDILSQMDLRKMGVQMVCVEWNSIDKEKYVNYCGNYGLILVEENFENLIFAI